MKIKLVFLLLSIFNILIISYCAEIDRDNLLDPKNSASSRQSVVVLEGFVTVSEDENQPQYNQYALEAFKVNSIAYLLKPIKFDDLLVTISSHS